ncbi:Single-stranded DNA-binding protein, mitochondrial [Morella rubra]|uniref:Single-stranded DNA-binding protein, mitochondrial n=1 Tax=Morella rubra TaxID=262757 RepID=A0A6A1UP25_9ROSI|nr:Single-stranded DNA-binding protein, mitochondrial [Morella rubra]
MSFSSDNEDGKNNVIEEDFGELLGDKAEELQPQGVDPRKGWGYRGVHKAIICGKVGQSPVQKILRNGRMVTIFTVGTGGMFDQRIVGAKDLPKPAQWHRIAVHNESLGAYAVQQLVKNSSVYVEGDIETRVYNDSINGEVKNIPEICIRRDEIYITEAKMTVLVLDGSEEGVGIRRSELNRFKTKYEGSEIFGDVSDVVGAGKIRLIKTGESLSSISFEELHIVRISSLMRNAGVLFCVVKIFGSESSCLSYHLQGGLGMKIGFCPWNCHFLTIALLLFVNYTLHYVLT